MAAHYDYQQPMRDEIRAVLSSNNGLLTLESLSSLPRLDSLMKESLRLRPGTMGTVLSNLHHNSSGWDPS